MVMQPDTGSKIAALSDREYGLVNNLLGRKVTETKERMRLEIPDTNIS